MIGNISLGWATGLDLSAAEVVAYLLDSRCHQYTFISAPVESVIVDVFI